MDEDDLGGRLRLLPTTELDATQRALARRIAATRVRSGRRSGYTAQLDDGRLIGPFNAFLRHPAIGTSQLDWAQAISAADVPADVRETVILTVAGAWGSVYVAYAHARAGRSAGLAESDVERLLAGENPTEASDEVVLTQHLTRAVVVDHRVSEALYADARTTFGESTLVALIALMGQYLATSALLTCFDVPAPE